jgi:hypothetical protein
MRFFTFVIFVSLSFSAYANDCGFEGPKDENWSSFKVMVVTQTKVYFIDENGNNMNAFLLRGDEVILANGKTVGGLTCATFIDGNGKFTSGALQKSALRELTAKLPSSDRIFGKWESAGSQWINAGVQVNKDAMALINGAILEIEPSTTTSKVKLSGDAASSSSVKQVEAFGPNIGYLGTDIGENREALDVPYDGSTIEFGKDMSNRIVEYETEDAIKNNPNCEMRFRLLSARYLVGQDNWNCGGHNVSFAGLYVKKN